MGRANGQANKTCDECEKYLKLIAAATEALAQKKVDFGYLNLVRKDYTDHLKADHFAVERK